MSETASFKSRRSSPTVAGQATFGMANLRPEKTGLPFIVFISQRDDASHSARVKVSPAPKVRQDEMASYAISPFGYKAGPQLTSKEETQLRHWINKNKETLPDYWDGKIEYTEDALEKLYSL